jgi:hypothetical protein
LNEMLEERRKELYRLMTGGLRHLGVDNYDLYVDRRKKIDVFDPGTAVFLVKADTEPVLTKSGISFITRNLENKNYNVKHIAQREGRLLLFI